MGSGKRVEPTSAVVGAGDRASSYATRPSRSVPVRDAVRTNTAPVADEVPALVREYLRLPDARVTFTRNESTGRWFVQILDAETGEVIREVPPEELERVFEVISRQTGVLVNRRR